MECIDLSVVESVVTDAASASAILRFYFFDPDGMAPSLPPGYGVCCLVRPGGKIELMVLCRSKK